MRHRASRLAAVLILCGSVAVACDDPAADFSAGVPTPVPGVDVPSQPVVYIAEHLDAVVQAPDPAPEAEPEPIIPGGHNDPWGPIQCPGAEHPAHHRPCPAPTVVRPNPSPAPSPVATPVEPAPALATTGSGACGGDLPPCWVMNVESGGDLRVWNGGCYAPVDHSGPGPCGSTASGKWQFIRSTWDWFGGVRNAADASEAVQDQKARLTWAGGAGCGHWNAC